MKNLFNFLLISLFIFCGCSSKSFAATPQALVNSTVEMTDAAGSIWTGVMIKQEDGYTYILSVVHDEPEVQLGLALGFEEFYARIEGKEVQKAYLVKWVPCTELAMFIIEDTYKHQISPIALKSSELGNELQTTGNPQGQGIKYSKGYLSAKDIINNSCTTWNSYSGGVVQGQTGSPVFNAKGRIEGLITAVSAREIPVYSLFGDQTGSTIIPVFHMGYYIPLQTIKGFIESMKDEVLRSYSS